MRSLIYLILLNLIVSCEIFETRDPELPTNSNNTFTPASTPDILFSNLINSFNEGVVENYLYCFVDQATLDKEYIFTPSTLALEKYPGLTDWSLNSERIYFSGLLSDTGGEAITVLLENEIGNTQGDSAIFFFDYTLILPVKNEVYKGSSEFTIFLDSRNQWFITGWRDFEKGEEPSWSELKGKYN